MTMNHDSPIRVRNVTMMAVAVLFDAGCQSNMDEAARDNQSSELGARRSPNNPRGAPTQAPAQMAPRPAPTALPTGLSEIRTIDGTFNNREQPTWGSANIAFLRRAPAAYGDGASSPSGADRPNARAVSEAVCAEHEPKINSLGASDLVWQWGQFLDHDIDLTPEVEPMQAFDIAVPVGDAWFDPFGTGQVAMHFGRSLFVEGTAVREQVNAITAFIDGSSVYGADAERAAALRTNDGTGRLRTSAGNLLPFNDAGLPNASPPGRDPASLFLAGDFRANEQVGLTVMHTLFVREHNRWAERLRAQDPSGTGDQIYEGARAMVAAEIQAITYRAFLPILLGPDALPAYEGYDPSVNPGITNTFATAAYRFGHSMLSTHIQRLNADATPTEEGPLALADAFFAPQVLTTEGLEPILRGLASQPARAIDLEVVDDVRNMLFGPPGAGGLDLTSLNIQRGRDHGLPGFGAVRRAYGLPVHSSFMALTSNRQTADALQTLYGQVDQVDPWVGILAEPPVAGGLVGPTARVILAEQFRRLRDGDRFWYETYLPADLVEQVNARSLADIIRDNTRVGAELRQEVFVTARP